MRPCRGERLGHVDAGCTMRRLRERFGDVECLQPAGVTHRHPRRMPVVAVVVVKCMINLNFPQGKEYGGPMSRPLVRSVRSRAQFGITMAFLAVLVTAATVLNFGLARGAWEFRVCDDPARMPFSSRDEAGFNNRIAAILADEMDAQLSYVWRPLEQLAAVQMDSLWSGDCDVVFGLPEGEAGFLNSAVYYRSPFAIAYVRGRGFEVQSLSDDVLSDLRIGVLGSVVIAALRNQGVRDNVVSWDVRTMYDGSQDYYGSIVDALVRGEIDVAVAWGPIISYFASQYPVEIVVVPVEPEIYPPFLIMAQSSVIGVRPGDTALRDRIDVSIARRWDEINDVLIEYGVPLSALPRLRESVRQ